MKRAILIVRYKDDRELEEVINGLRRLEASYSGFDAGDQESIEQFLTKLEVENQKES